VHLTNSHAAAQAKAMTIQTSSNREKWSKRRKDELGKELRLLLLRSSSWSWMREEHRKPATAT